MLADTVKLIDLYNTPSLVTRQAVRDLQKKVEPIQNHHLIFDFAGIESASRSFFNELYNYQSILQEKDIAIDNINISPFLFRLFEKVKEEKNNDSSEKFTPPGNTDFLTI